jgi:hypothetical protein
VLDGTGASTELVLELGVDTTLEEVEAKPGVDEWSLADTSNPSA